MARHKYLEVKSNVADAISDAISELTSLAEEIREVVDGAEGGRAQTQRIQTLDETASALEEISEPDIDGEIGKIEIAYHRMVPANIRRPLSRRDRCENACSILSMVLDLLDDKSNEWIEGNKEHQEDNPYEALIEELDEIKGNAEACEFPGMYG